MSNPSRSWYRRHARDFAFDDRMRHREQHAAAGNFGLTLYNFGVSAFRALRHAMPQQITISDGKSELHFLGDGKAVVVPAVTAIIDVTSGKAAQADREPVNIPVVSTAMVTPQQPAAVSGGVIEVVNGRVVQVAAPRPEKAENALVIAEKLNAEQYFGELTEHAIHYGRRITERSETSESARWAMYRTAGKTYKSFDAIDAAKIFNGMRRAVQVVSRFVKGDYFTRANGWVPREPETLEPRPDAPAIAIRPQRVLSGPNNDN